MDNTAIMAALERIEERLARVESRLVQLMFHSGMDPYARTYSEPKEGSG